MHLFLGHLLGLELLERGELVGSEHALRLLNDGVGDEGRVTIATPVTRAALLAVGWGSRGGAGGERRD